MAAAGTKEHSINPAWVVTFLRFNNRDPRVLGSASGAAEDTREPLVVTSDCISISAGETKDSPNGTCQMTLKLGDINYPTAIVPGDYFLVNIVNSEYKAEQIYRRIKGDKKSGPENINRPEDGFCGVFRVQSVHKTLVIDGNGKKVSVCNISGHSYTELNDVIYFNPYLVSAAEANNDVLFLTQLSTQWNKIIGLKNNNNSVQDLMILLFQVFLGKGIDERGRKLKGGLNRTENNLYLLPKGLGKLLGHPKAKYAADLVNMLCGIQKYKSNGNEAALKDKVNPVTNPNGRIHTTGNKVRGVSYAKPEYWNQVRVWDILNSYLNNVVNEIYTANRIDPVTGNVMPTLVVRQKPFTTDRFVKENPKVLATPYRSLPRWVPDTSEVYDFNIGRDDAAKINFVQVFGRSQSLMGGSNTDIDMQISQRNYSIDREDIKRSGLRPYIANSNFDYAASDVNSRITEAPLWAKLVGDWVIGGHLKFSGSVTMHGTEDPISVGDNFELDGILFHIEAVQKVASVRPDGKRSFKLMLQLSSGMVVEELSGQTEYAEMTQSDSNEYEKEKYIRNSETLEPASNSITHDPVASNRSDGEKTAPFVEKPFDIKPKSPRKSGSKIKINKGSNE